MKKRKRRTGHFFKSIDVLLGGAILTFLIFVTIALDRESEYASLEKRYNISNVTEKPQAPRWVADPDEQWQRSVLFTRNGETCTGKISTLGEPQDWYIFKDSMSCWMVTPAG